MKKTDYTVEEAFYLVATVAALAFANAENQRKHDSEAHLSSETIGREIVWIENRYLVSKE